MSTKIWVAYRMTNTRHLWPLVHDIRLKGTKSAQAAIRKMYEEFIPEVKTDTDAFKENLERFKGDEWRARFEVARDIVRKGYQMSNSSSERSPFNFDVSVGFRHYQNRIYLIPYCDWTMRDVLDFLKDDKRLGDFHYQNQTDKPEGITDAQWRKRERVWHGMDDADRWKDVLVLDICRWDMFCQLDPWLDMLKDRKSVVV